MTEVLAQITFGTWYKSLPQDGSVEVKKVVEGSLEMIVAICVETGDRFILEVIPNLST